MLTENQKQILDNLTAEFSKMNTPIERKQNRLIDVEGIASEKIEIDNRIRSLQMITDATDKAIHEMILDDMDRLNEDLSELGLVAVKENFTVSILRDNQNRQTHDPIIWFRYERLHKYEWFSDGRSITYYVGFRDIQSYVDSAHRSTSFKSIEDLTSNEKFIQLIKSNYARKSN